MRQIVHKFLCDETTSYQRIIIGIMFILATPLDYLNGSFCFEFLK